MSFDVEPHQILGRMNNLTITEGERYYVHLSITQIPGAISLDFFKPLDIVVHESVQETSKSMIRRNGDGW